MEAIRQIVDGRLLSSIITLPRYFQNTKVEIIVVPVKAAEEKLSFSRNDIDTMLAGTITETLIGAVPNKGKTLEDYRVERLGKYERFD
ncbi:MAG: hypothetical protein FWG53_01445 [Clostridiales bacterium]|nr:hypothetical protein [Clostridiales bacterium]